MNSILSGSIYDQMNILRRNPIQFLLQHRMSIPPEYMNDPEGAIRYMVNSGQVSQAQVESAKEYAKRLGVNI